MNYNYIAWLGVTLVGYAQRMTPQGACNDADYVLQRFRRTFPSVKDRGEAISPLVKYEV